LFFFCVLFFSFFSFFSFPSVVLQEREICVSAATRSSTNHTSEPKIG
jgi:hypothetical protein